MEIILSTVLYISLGVHVFMISIAAWRVWRGENMIDRLIGADLISTLFLAVLVIYAMLVRESIYIDVALGLAALSCVSTIAVAKYIADEQVY
jgi:multicomponent Na+:H+ antiporter subunit F